MDWEDVLLRATTAIRAGAVTAQHVPCPHLTSCWDAWHLWSWPQPSVYEDSDCYPPEAAATAAALIASRRELAADESHGLYGGESVIEASKITVFLGRCGLSHLLPVVQSQVRARSLAELIVLITRDSVLARAAIGVSDRRRLRVCAQDHLLVMAPPAPAPPTKHTLPDTRSRWPDGKSGSSSGGGGGGRSSSQRSSSSGSSSSRVPASPTPKPGTLESQRG